MSGSLNRATLIGHLGGDPEIRRTRDGKPIGNFSLATSESWKDAATGEKRERTEWHRIVVFSEGLAKIVEQYLKKGARVMVEGQIATRKWQDNNGQDRYSTEIVLQGFDAKLIMLGASGSGRPPGPNGPDDYGSSTPAQSQNQSMSASQMPADMDDEIPF